MGHLKEKFSELSALTRPVDNDILRYVSTLEVSTPFGLVVEDGEKVSEDIEKSLQNVGKTYEKLNAVKELASSIDEDLEKYGMDGNVVQLSVKERKKNLDEINENFKQRKEHVESQVVELKEFLSESEKMKPWLAEIQDQVDKIYVVDEEPESVEKQLNDVEVIKGFLDIF